MVKTAKWAPFGSEILVAVVDSEYTEPGKGDEMLRKVAQHFPTNGVMLVSIEENGFRAHAAFQTGVLLALLQLEALNFTEIDVDTPPVDDSELPF